MRVSGQVCLRVKRQSIWYLNILYYVVHYGILWYDDITILYYTTLHYSVVALSPKLYIVGV